MDVERNTVADRTGAKPQPAPITTIRRSRQRLLLATSDCPESGIEALWRDPDALVSSGGILKSGDRTTIVQLNLDGREVLLKRYNSKGPVHTLTHLMLRSRARWSWINGRRLLKKEFFTPAPLALVEERFGPLRLRSFLLTDFVTGIPLSEVVRDPNLTRSRSASLAREMSALWVMFERHRIGHGDMKATNFLVDDGDQIHLIDLDGMRWHPRGPTFHRAHERDRRRFLRNLDGPDVNPAARQAFRVHFGTA